MFKSKAQPFMPLEESMGSIGRQARDKARKRDRDTPKGPLGLSQAPRLG